MSNRITFALSCLGIALALFGAFLPTTPIAASVRDGLVEPEIGAKTDSLGSWVQVPGSTDSTLHAVSMVSITEGHAVGGIPYISGHPFQDSIIRRWDGATWEINKQSHS